MMNNMKHKRRMVSMVTLRNLPANLARILQKTAEADRTSLNKTVLALLEQRLGLGPKDPFARLHHDLDDLSGTWSAQEAAEFEEILVRQRGIDEELWR